MAHLQTSIWRHKLCYIYHSDVATATTCCRWRCRSPDATRQIPIYVNNIAADGHHVAKCTFPYCSILIPLSSHFYRIVVAFFFLSFKKNHCMTDVTWFFLQIVPLHDALRLSAQRMGFQALKLHSFCLFPIGVLSSNDVLFFNHTIEA